MTRKIINILTKNFRDKNYLPLKTILCEKKHKFVIFIVKNVQTC